jgi:transcriptional regulator
MYIPRHFAVTEAETLNQFITDNSFGLLTSLHQDRLFASHIPFLYDPTAGLLTGHLAKANPQHEDLDEQEVLIVLQGAHGYVSPNWYEQPGVPTWNYQAVHIYGQAQCFTAADELKQVVDDLTRQHEQDLPEPWSPDYDERMLNAIIGIRINITGIEGKFKLNQNRSVADRQGVVDHLDPKHQAELLQAMKGTL